MTEDLIPLQHEPNCLARYASLAGGFTPPCSCSPEWDPMVAAWIVKRTEHWVVMVTPMLYNDRVLIATHEEAAFFWTAGWCYDKGPAAGLAAQVFDPEVDMDPVGFKKLAADSRRTAREVDEINARLQGKR